MTTTIIDSNHGDQDDNEEGAQQPLQNHLRTENTESPTHFHKNLKNAKEYPHLANP